MTPLMLASDLDRSIAFLRDVVGYGLLPGETSDIETLASLPTSLRATVLAWYWPQRAYVEGFDPFAEFEAASRAHLVEHELHSRVRALTGNRVLWFLALAGFAAGRTMDEVVGAVCWRATCSGEQLIGVLDATHGLTFSQVLSTTETLGLHYIDPLDQELSVSSWATAAGELRSNVAGGVESVVDLALSLAFSGLADRVVQLKDQKSAREVLLRKFEGFLPDLSKGFFGLSEARILALARAAFEYRDRLADPSRFGELIADLTVGPDARERDRTAALLGELLAQIASDEAQVLAQALELVAQHVALLPDGLEEIDQGFGWLLLDRVRLGARIDRALAELESVTSARATIRKALSSTDERRSGARPGDTYRAPAPGTRYRTLYEALATMPDQFPILVLDPVSHRVQTSTRGWIDLPPSAFRDRAWWSGSGQSTTGRPQVRAWRSAGYDTPRLTTNNGGLIVSVQFLQLPGREGWIEAHDEDERLVRGQYTVPPAPNTPLHAVDSYGGPTVWRMGDEEIAALRTSFAARNAPAAADRSESGARLSEGEASSDATRIDQLVDFLRRHGESDRRGVEAFFASNEGELSENLVISKWLPNLLAKASRQGRIANIGTRKQSRWVKAGSAAHLAGLLTKVLERDEHGERITKLKAPKLAPGEAIPADLYRRVIRHAFAHVSPVPASAGADLSAVERDQTYLTDDGLRAVLAGRRLTDVGVRCLLNRIQLERWATWEAAATAAVPEAYDTVLDEDALFAAFTD